MKLIDLKTLGEDLSLSIFTIRKFIKQGMPHYKVGNKFLVSSKEVEPWLAQQFRHEKNIDTDDIGSIIDDVLSNLDK